MVDPEATDVYCLGGSNTSDTVVKEVADSAGSAGGGT